MKQFTLNYQVRRFNVISAFGDGEFDHLKDWMKGALHIDLDTCAVDIHVPWAEIQLDLCRKDSDLYNAKHSSINTPRD